MIATRPLLSVLVAASVLLASPIATAQSDVELLRAAEAGDVAGVERLLGLGFDLEARDEHGRTALVAAAQYGHKKLVLVLLARGAQIEAHDENGYTPLIWAAQQGHTAVVAALLARGADVGAREKHDYTALEWAAWEGHVNPIRLLLAYGGDAARRTHWGFTAADLARRHNRGELDKLFLPGERPKPMVATRPASPAPTPAQRPAQPVAQAPAAASAPPGVAWREVGKSRLGKAIKLATAGRGERGVMLIGSIHGDEAQGTDVINRLLRELPTMPGLMGRNRVIAVPNANPDGVSRRVRTNMGGVDLNRNFPTAWRPSARGRFFGGPRPLSEPESQALERVIEEEKPALIVSFHAHMACNNFDGHDAEPIARAMSRLNGYRVLPQIGYETPGSLGQHAAFGKGIPIVTLEVGFEAPDQLWHKVRDSLLVAFEPTRL